MNKEELKQKLTGQGFPIIYEWIDEPGTVYEEHEHKGRVAFYVTKGSVTFSGGIEKTLGPGEFIEVPIGVKHTALVGEDGCEYVVGEFSS